MALSLTALLTACTTTPSTVETPFGLERQGRFALQVKSPFEQPKAVQGNFRWQQTPDGWRMSLSSPVGATLARLSVNSSGALLQSPDSPDQRGASATALLQKMLGEPVPIDSLQYWIRGQLSDASDIRSVTRDASRRVTGFQQRGWRVTFSRYDDVGPTRMALAKQAEGRDVVLRLVVNEPIL